MLQDYQAAVQQAHAHAIKTYHITEDRIPELQARCGHPSLTWIDVEHVPEEMRQYKDDRDWVCGNCGALVPRFV